MHINTKRTPFETNLDQEGLLASADVQLRVRRILRIDPQLKIEREKLMMCPWCLICTIRLRTYREVGPANLALP